MKSQKLTGRHYFKRNWLGFLILYIEVEETKTDGDLVSTHEYVHTYFRKANEEDLIDNQFIVAK